MGYVYLPYLTGRVSNVGVQGAESFQAEYQKLIDTWMRRFTEIENSLARNKSKSNQDKNKGVEKSL
jgi:hypothetical protein